MKNKGRIWILLGMLFFLAAIGLAVCNLRTAQQAGMAADKALHQLLPQIEAAAAKTALSEPEPGYAEPELADEIEYPDYILNPNMDMPTEQIDGREYIGVLSIPAIGLELPVCGESNTYNLSCSPCRYKGSAYLDSMIICAHNYEAFFRNLKNLSYGDEVTFTDIDGNVFTYRVTELVNILPTAVEEMTSGDWDLTLFTCTPGAAYRVTVRCERG